MKILYAIAVCFLIGCSTPQWPVETPPNPKRPEHVEFSIAQKLALLKPSTNQLYGVETNTIVKITVYEEPNFKLPPNFKTNLMWFLQMSTNLNTWEILPDNKIGYVGSYLYVTNPPNNSTFRIYQPQP